MDAGSGAPCWVYDIPSYTYQRIIMALVEAKNLLIYFIYPTILGGRSIPRGQRDEELEINM